jgi:superfamily I DNA/RNA helicase
MPDENSSRYPIKLVFPESGNSLLESAAEAVRQEYRNSVRWKRLRCRSVQPVRENIYAIETGSSFEFDWTWEGATAFRPVDIQSFNGLIDPREIESIWAGEVVEADETAGRLYVAIEDPGSPPLSGSFHIRPFEFLKGLYNLFCDAGFSAEREYLAERLHACLGNTHPKINTPLLSGLSELRGLWASSWGILWGPPGTGKTFTIGRQVASILHDRSERILVVSTTNRATDEAAISIGRAARNSAHFDPDSNNILRIGKSPGYSRFHEYGLEEMLKGTETDILLEISELHRMLQTSQDFDQRAIIRRSINDLRRVIADNALHLFTSPEVKVVIGTSFNAISMLSRRQIKSLIRDGCAPFTTIIIDEAGLISRCAVAALSLLASRRVLLCGDSKQLAPISRISRVIPSAQAKWLESSALGHLEDTQQQGESVVILKTQHRMHPEISRAVSRYQYDGALLNGEGVANRPFACPSILENQPRTLWFVIDDDADSLPAIRAERGPGNRSWIRKATLPALDKLFSDKTFAESKGIFLSPFKAQAKSISDYFIRKGIPAWSSATIHSQQGTETDIVIFDTVNAGSCGWPYDEWKRLVNVGISRARETVVLIASRAEMGEPYLNQLKEAFAPRRLSWNGSRYLFETASVEGIPDTSIDAGSDPALLGNQIRLRKQLRPILSSDQQRLVGLKMDGKPRLVRGVAGSGKTVVMAHWLVETLRKFSDNPDARIWAVFANKALEGLIKKSLEDAWNTPGTTGQFPWNKVSLLHIKDILEPRLRSVGLNPRSYNYDWDRASSDYLKRIQLDQVEHCCEAIFIDEAQDMGPNTLKLLSNLARQTDPEQPRNRSVNILYDNAQNLYHRATPRWSEINLDMRGRSTIMKESFRSTSQITEFALNLLYTLQPPVNDEDYKELRKLGLVEEVMRADRLWRKVKFNHVNGPLPVYKKYDNLEREIDAIGDQLVRWIRDESVNPDDICILYIGENVRWRIENQLVPKLKNIGKRLLVQTSQSFSFDGKTVHATTPQSFKGYDSEIIVIAGINQFIAGGQILGNTLYVAMTRARSLLYIYGKSTSSVNELRLLHAVEYCLDCLKERPAIDNAISKYDDIHDILEIIGNDHQAWLESLWEKYAVEQEPIIAEDGEILGEPLFWFKAGDRRYACFGQDLPGASVRHKIEDSGITIILPGEEI